MVVKKTLENYRKSPFGAYSPLCEAELKEYLEKYSRQFQQNEALSDQRYPSSATVISATPAALPQRAGSELKVREMAGLLEHMKALKSKNLTCIINTTLRQIAR